MGRRRRWGERLLRRYFYKYYARNLLYPLQIRARDESADYVRAHMADARMFEDRAALLAACLEWAPTEGHVLEFGVAAGASLRQIAACTPRPVHGFDSFQGLPEDWTGTFEGRGKFSTGGRLPTVPSHVALHADWFEESVPRFLAAHPGPVAFVHVDCDLYSSTRTVLWGIAARFVPGTVLLFDEYFNYPNWQQHEFRAFQEFVAAAGAQYRYLGYSVQNGHVAVALTDPGRLPPSAAG